MNVIWIASYPRSGNTYLRFLLYTYLYGDVTDSAVLEKTIPDLHKSSGSLNLNGEGHRFVKTHYRYSIQHPLLNRTGGFIYLLRNPRDVMLSNIRYINLISEQNFDERFLAEKFVENLGAPRWKNLGFGSWPQHFASWMEAATHLPHLFIRYEQLKADPAAELRRISEFLELPVKEERIDFAVQRSSLDSMRSLEQKEKEAKNTSVVFDGRGGRDTFVGKGRSGQKLEHLGEDLAKAYETRFASFTKMLGY